MFAKQGGNSMKVLKFVGLIVGMAVVAGYIPFGIWICMIVNAIALWKLVND